MANLQGLAGRSMQGFTRSLQGFITEELLSDYTMFHNKRMAFDGTHFYTSYNKQILKYDMTVAQVDSQSMTNPFGSNPATARDLVFDGTHLYVISTPGVSILPTSYTNQRVVIEKYDTDLNRLSYTCLPRGMDGGQLWPYLLSQVQITFDDDYLYISLLDFLLEEVSTDYYVIKISKTLNNGTASRVDFWDIAPGSTAIHEFGGEFFASYSNKLKVYEPSGSLDREISTNSTTDGIYADSNGFYISRTNGVDILDSSEAFVETKSTIGQVYDCVVDGSDLWFIRGTSKLTKVTI